MRKRLRLRENRRKGRKKELHILCVRERERGRGCMYQRYDMKQPHQKHLYKA